MVVPPLKKDSSRENKDRAGNKKQNNRNKSFGMLLDSEQEKVKDRDVVITAAGYTRDAKAVSMLYRTREYA